MTTTKLTRRAALAGTVALPLAPAAAMATAEFPQSAEPDPAVLAFHEWREALLANNACRHDSDTPEGAPFYQRYDAAEEAMFDVVPTTPEGLACKARFVANVSGDLRADGDPAEPEDYLCHKWPNDEELRFINSLLTYAERQAGRPV